MSDVTPTNGPEPDSGPPPLDRLPEGELEVKRAEATSKHAAFMKNQARRKKITATVGVAAALAGVGAPALTPSDHSFPAFINNGTCSTDGGKANGKPLEADDARRNELKNRTMVPGEAQVADAITLDHFLGMAPGEKPEDTLEKSEILSEEMAARVTGYIVKIIPGGPETCNCQTNDKSSWDTHIYLSRDDPTKRPPHKDGDPSPTQHDMIVEVTPRMRQLLKPGTHDWDTDTLHDAFPAGTKVTVTGWQFYDKEHEAQSFNIHKKPTNWRYSCWEIHPVTEIVKAQ